MIVRDPFNLHSHKTPASLQLLRATATRAANETGDLTVEREAELAKGASEDMSFTVPKNIPSFSNPQRQAEDRLWPSAALTARSKGGLGVPEKVGRLFHPERDTLPMYKDKPFAYAPSRRLRPCFKRKSVLGFFLVFVLAALWYSGLFSNHHARVGEWEWMKKDGMARNKVDWLKRRESVVEAMELSWDGYEKHAWGYDEFQPIAKKGGQMAPKGLGWIIIDSLDTLMIMNLTSRLIHAREWLSNSLTWDQDQEVSTFETTIRMLGGLLSAHYLSSTFPDMAPIAEDDPGKAGEDLYLEKAKDLADRLMAAFESPSGIPFANVNLGQFKGIEPEAYQGASSTAEATTLQLEFKYLAKLTGEKDFWDRVEKVMQVVDDQGARDGLVPIFIYPTTGKFMGDNIRLGSRGDSYYEYLIKQYLQTNRTETIYLDMWRHALEGVRKHLITYSKPSRFTIVGERPNGLDGILSPKMDHLVCFLPGTIALGATGGLAEAEARKLPTWTAQDEADMKLARELMQTCWGMYKYTATGLAAEITHFEIDEPPLPESAPHQAPASLDADPEAIWRKDFDVRTQDAHNLQRPETVESLFYMWRITGNSKYRDWGWEMFKSFVEHTAVEDGGGFTSLADANKVPAEPADNMESFWIAETLKYFYLLFSPKDMLPLDRIVFNTEAHPFPCFDMGPLFTTGWKRKARDKEGSILA